MKVRFHALPKGIEHALRQADVERVREVVPDVIIKQVKLIDVYYNANTTLQGLTTFRRTDVVIRINFCLKNGRSSLRNHRQKEIPFLKSLGATIDSSVQEVIWTPEAARRFALFIVLHELSHIIYARTFPETADNAHTSRYEEDWCDRTAKEMLHTLIATE